jgi:hypothetical protein
MCEYGKWIRQPALNFLKEALRLRVAKRRLGDPVQRRIHSFIHCEAIDRTLCERFYQHLLRSLKLPCDVTGIEDFRWEEYYILGPGDEAEYEKLCKTQPSYQDTFELLAIEKEVFSEWMMFDGEDLVARVRRKSDDKEFSYPISIGFHHARQRDSTKPFGTGRYAPA